MNMKEIAKLANVSQPTVSRVINGNIDVNKDIAKKVLRIIEEVGYTPNRAAQTLKRSRSNIIGVSVSQIFNPYFMELIDAIELKARQIGYNIILHNSKLNPVTEWENIQNFIARQVDGIIIVPSGQYNIERISKLDIPTIVVTQYSNILDCVMLNHIQAGKMVGEKFIQTGHKKFGFIGPKNDEKFLGLNSSLYENGLTFDPKNFIETDLKSTTNYMIRQDIERYFNKIDKLDFTCVSTSNDIEAVEFMKAAQKRNIRIPEDISIIGFDDTYLSKIFGISSVHQPIDKMIDTAIEIIKKRIDNELSEELINIQMEPILIERDSCKIIR